MRTSFKPPSKGLTPRDLQFIVLALFGVFLFSAVLVYVNINFVNGLGGGGEFYLPWVGARAFLIDNFDPYSSYVPERVQDLVYDRAVQAGNEPYILDIPFDLLLPFFPFALLADPAVARAIFTLIVELALFGLAYLSLRLTDLEAPPILGFLIFLFFVVNYYTFQAVLAGTPVLLLGLSYAYILYALRVGQDEIAGGLAFLSFYHWEVGGPFLVLLFLYVLYNRRFRVLAGFGMIGSVLFLLSLFLYPNWIIPFLRATLNNLRADFGFTTHVVLAQLWPSSGDRLAWILTAGLLIALGYEFILARSSDFRRFYWTACLSLAASPLLGLRTEMENLVVLMLPLGLVIAVAYERWRRIRGLLVILILLILFIVPWGVGLFGSSILGDRTEPVLFLFFPTITLIGIYWIRWWTIRPPRTWFDQARS